VGKLQGGALLRQVDCLDGLGVGGRGVKRHKMCILRSFLSLLAESHSLFRKRHVCVPPTLPYGSHFIAIRTCPPPPYTAPGFFHASQAGDLTCPPPPYTAPGFFRAAPRISGRGPHVGRPASARGGLWPQPRRPRPAAAADATTGVGEERVWRVGWWGAGCGKRGRVGRGVQ
jgi:hypothetical protein